MTGYDLTRKLRKTRRRYQLTATEQALFHELVAICNEDEWPDTFQCSNDELSRALNISENTLVSSRNTLIQSGLIAYKSGKSKRQFGIYSLSTTSNIEVDTGTVTGGDTGTNPCTNPDTNAADYYKTKQKSKKQTKHSVSNETGAGKISDQLKAEKEKRKKSSAQKKKASPGITPAKVLTPHWQILIRTWFDFYKDKFSEEPTFTGTAAKGLQTIVKRLEALAKQKGYEWKEEYAKRVFTHFLIKAYGDGFYKQTFLLHVLASHFDAIIQRKDETGTTKNGRPATGSAVNTASAFDAIDKAFGGLGSGPNG